VTTPPHTLVVGGTGMLRGVCLHFAALGHNISVIARSHARLSQLAQSAAGMGGSIWPLAADYHDDQRLALALRAARTARGPIRLAIAWIHGSAGRAPLLVAQTIAPPAGAAQCRFFHVVGSEADDVAPGPALDRDISTMDGVLYRRIVLGFVVEPGGSRWLTNEEIATGVVRAIDHDALRTTIGTTGPRSARP
jgi:NAD(P)-dependent dehydrogenase (short-subunit alcohol dehydrogenase family)